MNHISGTAYHTSRHMCNYMHTPKFANDKNLLFPSSQPSINQNESLMPCFVILSASLSAHFGHVIRIHGWCQSQRAEYVLFDVVCKRHLGWEQKGLQGWVKCIHVVIVLKNVPEFHRRPFILDLKEEHEPCKPALKSRVTQGGGGMGIQNQT